MNKIARWAPAILAALVLAGCGTAAATTPGHPAATPPAHRTATAPAHRTATAPPSHVVTAPAAQAPSQHVLAGHPAGPSDLYPLGVVYRYYDDLNAHDYSDAWNNLGGNNIAAQNGQTYDSWVAGYSAVAGLYISGRDLGAYAGDHLVQVSITVTQKDGTVQHYAGTYTLRAVDVMDYVMIAANIHATSGSAAAPAQDGSAPATSAPATLNGVTRPTEIVFSGDSTNAARNLTWSQWGSAQAVGNGTVIHEGCVPDCATGTQTPYPVHIILSSPVNGRYTQVTETIESGPDAGTTTSAITPTWPFAS